MPKVTIPRALQAQNQRGGAVVPSYTRACDIAAEGVVKHGKASNTSNAYGGHIQRGKKFLEQFIREEGEAEERWKHKEDAANNLAVDGEDEMDKADAQAKMHPQFSKAFDGPPIECTPLAIALFMSHKCFVENCKKSTAEQIHAAFHWYYVKM